MIRGRLRTVLLGTALGVLGLGFNLGMAVLTRGGWGVDYNQFYCASRLAGTPHSYDWEALRKAEVEHGVEMPTARWPVVLYGHKLLSWMPFRTAQLVWLGLSVAALAGFAFLWPGTRPGVLLLALAWSMPAALLLLYGQDVPLVLFFFSAGVLLLEKRRPWLAGLLFSLCVCKFHLALGVPVLLAARKAWLGLVAGAAAIGLLLAASFAIDGPGWPGRYLKMIQLPSMSPAPERMPSLHGLASWVPGTLALEIAGSIVVVVLLWRMCRVSSLPLAGAAATACGVLLANHAYVGDTVLLIPLAVLTIGRPDTPPWLRMWALVLLSPALVLLLISRQPYLGQLLVAPFVVTVLVREAPPGYSWLRPGRK